MKIVIGEKVFDSTRVPTMLLLSAEDKLSLFRMVIENPNAGYVYHVPADMKPGQVQTFVDQGLELAARAERKAVEPPPVAAAAEAKEPGANTVPFPTKTNPPE